ncbi:hypothetical protein [Candidatus Nanohalovita haloferacivicina]|uniref:hypothetical protein n=1 Tax=Candidatus Nanohalovita haloferacivicina TaxID=2978046 RepID=UPI00325FDCAE|nr:hypothetical protein HBNXNv_1170 [Candidatus Nanohalobia archaeon BNXNv]
MGLRNKVVKGFTDAYLRAERRLVVDLLRNGRLTQNEWNQIAQDLNQIAEKFQQEELDHNGFIQNRKQLERKIIKEKQKKEQGLKGEEARKLYEKYRERHQPVMEKAFHSSDKHTFYFLYKLPVIKTRYMITGLRMQ